MKNSTKYLTFLSLVRVHPLSAILIQRNSFFHRILKPIRADFYSCPNSLLQSCSKNSPEGKLNYKDTLLSSSFKNLDHSMNDDIVDENFISDLELQSKEIADLKKQTHPENDYGKSYVASIKSYNIGGMVKHPNESILMEFGDQPNLVALTGETGSGKSLLLAHVVNLIKGNNHKKSVISLRSTSDSNDQNNIIVASCEIDMKLAEAHKSFVWNQLEDLGLSPTKVLFQDSTKMDPSINSSLFNLRLKRTFLTGKPSKQNKNSTYRLKSRYEINGYVVPGKVMKAIATPLITTVDAATAAAALSKPQSRMDIIDFNISGDIKKMVQNRKNVYRKARIERERLEYELENRILPVNFQHNHNNEQRNEEEIELLEHWIQELDQFETRVNSFIEQISMSSSLGGDDNYGENFDQSSSIDIGEKLRNSQWMEEDTNETRKKDMSPLLPVSELYQNLIDFRSYIKALDEQIQSAHAACESLSSLSSPRSVKTLLEEVRNLIFDASGNSNEPYSTDDSVINAAEKSHELLNQLEDVLVECSQSIEDDPNGLLAELSKKKQRLGMFSLEDFDYLLGDWGALARKHGVSSESLPFCHQSLRNELDGNVEIMSRLPKAIEEEQIALRDFQDACKQLSCERLKVSNALTKSVSERLPSLGMEGSKFQVELKSSIEKCSESSYTQGGILGVDSVEFLLLHQGSENGMSAGDNDSVTSSNEDNCISRGGKLELVGSSGEKARILLAIETDIPGSMSEVCRYGAQSKITKENKISTRPVAMIYDEIDAHVGGRAAVAVAKLLSDQTQGKKSTYFDNQSKDFGLNEESRRIQVICITHSPSLAAVADCHVVIQKSRKVSVSNDAKGIDDLKTEIIVETVINEARKKEIARMASGDLAIEEAESFAEALLRDGYLHTNRKLA